LARKLLNLALKTVFVSDFEESVRLKQPETSNAAKPRRCRNDQNKWNWRAVN